MPSSSNPAASSEAIRARRAEQKGKRPVRVANCSGYASDPAWQMLKQATGGDIDFITGDYLAGRFCLNTISIYLSSIYAELNLAANAEAFRTGTHNGWIDTAWEGLQQSIDVIAERGIKVVINGGGLNPSGLASKVSALACLLPLHKD